MSMPRDFAAARTAAELGVPFLLRQLVWVLRKINLRERGEGGGL